MALNRIFIGFFVIGFVMAIIRFASFWLVDAGVELPWEVALSDRDIFKAMVDSTFDMAKTSVDISIYLIGIMTLWLGIMKVGEDGGAVGVLSRWVSPFFRKLFPDLPKDHPATGSILMNFSANMLGLDNAATPLGLKAMEQLQDLNQEKETASNAMIMFLVLNTSGLTLIPISVMALRGAEGAANPTDVFIPILLATFCASIAGLIVVAIKQKINLLDRTILSVLIGGIVLIALSLYGASQMDKEQLGVVSSIIGNFILLFIVVSFIWMAGRKKLNVYNSFIEGAKDGFKTSIGIIPYLVAILVAIGLFRTSGALELVVGGVRMLVDFTGLDSRFVDALPTAFMKPLSGSGARGMMLETMNNFGADSFAGRLSSIMQGSTETTFYTLAVYYGAVKIKNTRYTVTAGLIADGIGILAAIFIAYFFFG